MTAPLPLCVIGAGLIGLRHIEVATASDRIRLTAVVEPHAATRDRLARQGLPTCASLDDLPAETRAAVIATPTPTHRRLAIDCLGRGLAVLAEKPLAGTLEDAREMIAAAEAQGLPLVTGHHRRCHPFSTAARGALTRIGAPVGLQGFWSLRKPDAYYEPDWRRQPGAGPLLTNLSHEIDLLRFLLGEVTEVTALLSSARRGLPIEDTAALALRFANGALGTFLISDAGASPWSFETASAENPTIGASGQDYLRLTGTMGALSFPSLTLWQQAAPGETDWKHPMTPTPGPAFDKIDPLRAQIDRFSALLSGKPDDVLATGADGLAALEMTLATALSGHSGHLVTRGEVPGDFTGILPLQPEGATT